MSFLRYAKSGHIAKRGQLEPARSVGKKRPVWFLGALVVGVGLATLVRAVEPSTAFAFVDTTSDTQADGALSDGAVSDGQESANHVDVSADDLIAEAERLHELAQSGEARASEKPEAQKGANDANGQNKTDGQAKTDGKTSLAPQSPTTTESNAAAEPANASATNSKQPKLAVLTAEPAVAKPASSKPSKPKVRDIPVEVTLTDRIRKGETLGLALSRHGVSMDHVNHLVRGLKGILDVRSIRPGDAYTIADHTLIAPGEERPKAPAKMSRFEFRPRSLAYGPTIIVADLIEGSKGGVRYLASKQTTPVETKVDAITGTVSSSLYVSLKEQGEGSALVNAFADVFAWNIDFYRETLRGDKYKVIVEKKYAEGRFIGYGRVLAAEYKSPHRTLRGFNFRSKDRKVVGVFDDKGDSLERTFLKSAMEVTRVTSSFGQRFHPVLKRWRAHNGIDYGAPTGTPFWAVADGTVIEARYSKSAGNMIVLRHANNYTTEYFHASRFAKGLKVGQRVKQRQVIGYVGSTGRSTGPHLHFGMRKHGSHVDPKKQKFPAANPVPPKYHEEYIRSITDLRAELEALEVS